MLSDFELMNIHKEVLFIHNQNHRIVGLNSSDCRPPPRFFLGRTREGNVWRFRKDLPTEILVKLDELAASEPVSSRFNDNPVHFKDYQRILETHSRVSSIWIGPAYRFPYRIKQHENEVIQIQKNNSHYMEKGFADSIADLEKSQPFIALIKDGIAVSICCSARAIEIAAEAGVETLEYYRGKGYAVEVVSMWARKIRESGRIPLYSTSLTNQASLKVAGKLHMKQYGADIHFT